MGLNLCCEKGIFMSQNFHKWWKRSTHVRSLSMKVDAPFNFINGKRTNPSDSFGLMTVIDPSRNKLLCFVPASGEIEVNLAVSAAKEAFSQWSKFPVVERGRLLQSAGKRIRDHLEDLARLEVTNNGKPIWEARVDVASCADSLEYFGGIIPAFTGQYIPLQQSSFAVTCREPLGVIAGIGAWNFPLQTCTWKAAPALACGNTMVYKPSQFTPLTALSLAEILSDVGVPNGVFNVVQGEGSTGSLLCKHHDVNKISFTGSVTTGVKVATIAASHMKKVTLELGGKSPLIVFDDANMTNAIKGTLMANFLTQGEVCSNGTRVYVQDTIFSEFTDRLVKETKKLKIGNPHDEDTTVGATISQEHANKVLNYIEEAKGDGVTVLCGGERVILPPPLEEGFYLSPCILIDCHDDMTIVRDEVFGAVLSLLKFSSEEEVLNRANNSQFGLAGAVFTKDLNRALRVVHGLQCGTAWINTYNLYPPQLPFGGYKWSGIGRENGQAVLEHYTQLKTIYTEMGDVDCGLLCPDLCS